MLLSQKKAVGLLRKYKIKFPKTSRTGLKYPVVLKVDSPDVVHKSDLGLVATNLHNASEVKEKMREMELVLKKNKITKYKFIVQETIKGCEVIIGMKKDPTFGPVIIFGIGGIFVEAMQDVSMRIAPLTRKDCNFMIEEIKGKKVLEGFRGLPKANKEKIIDLLMKASNMAMTENLKEFDFNPVMVNEKDAYVVDARFVNA